MDFAFQVWLLDRPVTLKGGTSTTYRKKNGTAGYSESKEVGTDVVINTVRHPKQQIK